MITIRRLPGLKFILRFALCILTLLSSHAAAPVITNIRAAQRPGTQLIDIHYNLSDPDGDSPITIHLAISSNAGATYNVPVFTTTGAIGPNVAPGNDRHIIWNAGTDWPGQYSSQCRIRITADDNTAPSAPAGMVYIRAGVFQMGDSFFEGIIDELPLHEVFVSAFFMDENLVTREQWLDVLTWALGHGYTFEEAYSSDGPNHPVHSMNWWECLKWCNARSEKDNLAPVYYTDETQRVLYRTGTRNLSNACVRWAAGGYRLPTEAEWERGARAGRAGYRFPWGNTITHTQANYQSTIGQSYDVSATRGRHPIYGAATSPVGSFPANDYGLFDMAGNLFQWCWDSNDKYVGFGEPFRIPAASVDPRGSEIGGNRVVRGGAWLNDASYCRVAARIGSPPGGGFRNIGFRSVRSIQN